MKPAVRILAFIFAAAVLCFAFTACSDSEESTIVTHYHSGLEYADADYDKIEAEVEHEDSETMTALMKDITAGKYDNKVVQMEGYNTKYGESCGIYEINEEGYLVGIMYYIIDGTFPTDYPAKDEHIKLKGLVVVSEETGARHLEVPKDMLEILN